MTASIVNPYQVTFQATALPEVNAKSLKSLHEICSSYFFDKKFALSQSFFNKNSTLSQSLITFEANELNSFLEQFIFEVINEDKLDSTQTLNRLSELIPLPSLQTALNIDPIEEARKLASSAKYYFEINKKHFSDKLQHLLSSFLDSLISFINSFVATFGIADFFRPAESEIHADFKSQKIMMLLSIFTMLTTVILPLVGAASGAIAIGHCCSQYCVGGHQTEAQPPSW